MDYAFIENLYRVYGRSVFRRARSLLGQTHAAEDAVQEVFLRAFHARAEFAAEVSPMSWLYRVTTNFCLNQLRDSKRRSELLNDVGSVPAVDVLQSAPIEQTLTLRRLMQDVPEPLQEIAVYYYVDEMSQNEIAELLDMPRRTVAFRLEQFRELASPDSAGHKAVAR